MDARNLPIGADATPGSDQHTLHVLIIGAGFAGICAGVRLREAGIKNFRIYEKSGGVGGTWYDNTYPGAACDVPSHFYCFSFEPNPNWSRVYSPQPEIQAYLEKCVDKYGLRGHLVNHAKIDELRFDDATGLWTAHFSDGKRVRARHIINATGGLHEPSLPELPGREAFEGVQMHTARWDHEADLTGKRVAMVGSAASAIQVAPELAKIVEKLFIFQRTPNYIAPRMDRDYKDWEKALFKNAPWLAKLYRWSIFIRMDLFVFPITRKGSWFGRRMAQRINRFMRSVISDETEIDALTPKYDLGCKRILISDEFYKTLELEQVELVPEAVGEVTADGVVAASGEKFPVDAIIYATGYDIEKHFRAIDVFGRDGLSLTEEWAQGPQAYRGACVAGFPNYYLATGPNTGVGTTSVVYMIEQQMHLIMDLILKAGDDQLVDVKKTAQDAYNEHIQAALNETVWASGGCDSWYRGPGGRISILYPHDARSFRRQQIAAPIDHFSFSPVRVGTD